MAKPSNSSNASPPLRLELAPSRALACALAALGIASGAGLVLTDLPAPAALLLAPVAIAWGLVLARRELRRATDVLVLRADGVVVANGVVVDAFRLDWQGVLARLDWRVKGRRHVRVAWPDVLGAAVRRELRLWALGRDVRAMTAAVAP